MEQTKTPGLGLVREFNCRGCLADTCEGCSELPVLRAQQKVKSSTCVEVPPAKRVPEGVDIPIHNMEVSVPVKQQVMEFDPMDTEQVNLVKCTVGKDLTSTEFKLFMYLASRYQLDPIRRQIWAVKYGDNPAQIFTGRDGFLQIAHRSGHFDGMRSDIYRNEDGTPKLDKDGNPLGAWCEVWRNDMSHSFRSDVLFSEYAQPIPKSGKLGLWQTKKAVMIVKVAESVCLRKAFAVSGLYAPEEMAKP